MIRTITKEELNKWLEKGISNVAYLSLGLGLENTASSAFIKAKVRDALYMTVMFQLRVLDVVHCGNFCEGLKFKFQSMLVLCMHTPKLPNTQKEYVPPSSSEKKDWEAERGEDTQTEDTDSFDEDDPTEDDSS